MFGTALAKNRLRRTTGLVTLSLLLTIFQPVMVAWADAPSISINSIAPIETCSFPYAQSVTGSISHSPNITSLTDLKLFVNNTQVGSTINPASPFSLPWSITASGTYTVKVEARHGGSTGSSEITVDVTCEEVEENTPPFITLLGDNPLELLVDDPYEDPGATAEDAEDGDITEDIIVGGDTVDTSTPGSYTVTYNVTDSDGAAAEEVTRVVNVNEPELGEENTLELCTDNFDNDEDGDTDLEDEDCASFAASLTIVKVVINDNEGTATTTDFNLFANAIDMVSGVLKVLLIGDYVVSEEGPGGYTASFSDDCDEDGNITLGAGDDKTCTITNDDPEEILKPTEDTLFLCSDELDNDEDELTDLSDPDCEAYLPTVTVEKEVINDNDGISTVEDFSFFIDDAEVSLGETIILELGAHIVTETGPDGYEATFGGDCAEDGTIILEAGDALTCTIVNNDIDDTPQEQNEESTSGGGGGGGGGGAAPQQNNTGTQTTNQSSQPVNSPAQTQPLTFTSFGDEGSDDDEPIESEVASPEETPTNDDAINDEDGTTLLANIFSAFNPTNWGWLEFWIILMLILLIAFYYLAGKRKKK